MKKIIILVLLCLIVAPLFGAYYRTGTVEKIFIGEKYISPGRMSRVVYFKFEKNTELPAYSVDFQDCAGDGQYYVIELDADSTVLNKNTAFYYFYPLIIYSNQFAKDMTIDISNNSKCQDPAEKEIPVNYMFINF